MPTRFFYPNGGEQERKYSNNRETTRNTHQVGDRERCISYFYLRLRRRTAFKIGLKSE
jgi:hypothetical protein